MISNENNIPEDDEFIEGIDIEDMEYQLPEDMEFNTDIDMMEVDMDMDDDDSIDVLSYDSYNRKTSKTLKIKNSETYVEGVEYDTVKFKVEDSYMMTNDCSLSVEDEEIIYDIIKNKYPFLSNISDGRSSVKPTELEFIANSIYTEVVSMKCDIEMIDIIIFLTTISRVNIHTFLMQCTDSTFARIMENMSEDIKKKVMGYVSRNRSESKGEIYDPNIKEIDLFKLI